MTKKYLNITVDVEFGEAELPPATKKWFKEVIEKDDILAADLLRDLAYEFAQLYDTAYNNLLENIKERKGPTFGAKQ